jgi:high-affinity nickel-transport protein
MYPIGVLFGLGFDTASQIALLGISATQGAQQAPLWSIMIFPLLFTAGMCLVDTTDGIVMVGAYGWAFVRPVRKLFYNMTITFISFLIALIIGGLEVVSIIAAKWQLEGGVWAYVNILGDDENSGRLGYVIIGLLVVCWIGSMIYYRVANLDQYDHNPEAPATP